MSNSINNPVESLQSKLNEQRLLLSESYDKISIHLDLLNLDLKRNLSTDYYSNQVRIAQLEKAKNNVLNHIFFIDDLLNKIGGSYNAVAN